MSIKIRAKFVYHQIDDDVVMVGFADDQYETEKYVLLQRYLTPDQSDIDCGYHHVHVTINDQNNSAYGAIQSMICTKTNVTIIIKKETASELQIDDKIEIIIDCDGFGSDVFKNTLISLFKEESDSLEIY